MLRIGLAERLYSCDLRTPRWLLPFAQRLESHFVNRVRGHHTQMLAAPSLWDLAFGAFGEPRRWQVEVGEACGLDGGEHRPMAMPRGIGVIAKGAVRQQRRAR